MSMDELIKRGLGVAGPTPKKNEAPKLLGFVRTSVPEVDFTIRSGITRLPDEDQGSSGSCTMQAFSFGFKHLTGIDLLRQDGYSRIALPSGGAYPHQPFDLMNSAGNLDRENHSDPSPQTEENMTELVTLTEGDERKMFKVTRHNINNDIDSIAYAIKAYGGVTGCYNVTWEGWIDASHPQPPEPTDTQYAGSHMVWHYDYELEDGEKTIIAQSSWGDLVKDHRFKSNYYQKHGQTFSFYAMEVEELIMNEAIVILSYKGKMGLAFFGGFTGNILFASTMDNLKKLCDVYKKAYNMDASGNIIPEFTIN